MNHVTLPSVTGQITLQRALEVLKKFGRSGLVADFPSRQVVVEINDILSTWRQKGGNTLLEKVVPRATSVRLPVETSAAGVLQRFGMRQTAESLLESARADYAVTQVRGEEGEVITRDDRQVESLQSRPAVFRCTKDRNHVWLESDLKDRKCPIDGAPAEPD